ncbi:hypothetical protein [Bacillus phage Anath]|uniref:Uncharacterized protein n=1 Tax=Bacillus phage Anath TaxID=2108114 RepID=A0A2P1JUQ1_9CAUD|nr:hypothetical protein [Bacillus phage Anath]
MSTIELQALLGVAKRVRKTQEHNKLIIKEGLERGLTMDEITHGASHLKGNSAYQSVSIQSAYNNSEVSDLNRFYAVCYNLEKEGLVIIKKYRKYKTTIRLTLKGMNYLKKLKSMNK